MKNLFTDIETIPSQKEGALDDILKNVRPPAQYKKPESIQKWIDDNAEQVAVEQWKKTALEGISGEICSIAWAFDDEEVHAVTRVDRDDPEKDLLEGFFAGLEQKILDGQGQYPDWKWIGHNILDFDLRFLFQRAVILGVIPPVRLPVDARHGSERVYDTMKAWAGWKGYAKLETILEACGVFIEAPAGLDEIDGSMVWDLFQSGQVAKIREYNKLDVLRVRELYRRLTWVR